MSDTNMDRTMKRMIDILLSVVIACIVIWLTAGCTADLEYSPWEWDAPDTDLIEKNIDELNHISDPEFKPFTIAVAGDSQMGIAGLRDIIETLNSKDDVSFLIVAGDLTDLGLQREYTWFYDSIKKYAAPVFTVIGNHDGLNNGPYIYKELFGDFNYAFSFNGIQFIMWNNNYYEFGTPDFGWLEDQIEHANRNVIISHIPPYSGILPDEIEEEWRLIRQDPSVLVTIHGHVHDFRLDLEDGWLPIFTVERTENGEFGMISFKEDGIDFYKCRGESREEMGTCSIDMQ